MSFRTYFPQGSYKPDSGSELYDSDFEERFSRYLIQEIPNIESVAGDTSADKVRKFLDENPLRFDEALKKTHRYIKTKRITHYISGIDLGAAVYCISTSKEKLGSTKAELEVGQEYLAGIGGGVKSVRERRHRQKRKHCIGEIDGKRKGVVGYNLQPIFELVTHEQIKKLLQQSIMFYLDRKRKSVHRGCSPPWILLYMPPP